jgi:NAD(P)-dependent dehydrogenase (short-subunit alcohol dehydrogenase family)
MPPIPRAYFAAKAAMDALAVSYAGELIRFGIETSIVVPGAFTSGTSHFAHAGHPADTGTADAYDAKYGELMADVNKRLADLMPPEANVSEVADAIVRIVDLPSGSRPFRVQVVSVVADRIRAEFYRRVGLGDLLSAGSSV